MTKTVVIVDDSNFQRIWLKQALKDDDYIIFEGENGYDALELAEKHKPDCMLLDILMPEMDGIETLAELRKRGLQIPVIIVTADIQESTHKQCIALGAKAVVGKPFNKDKLRSIISDILSGANQ